LLNSSETISLSLSRFKVEYKDQLAFEVKKASDGQPVEFRPAQNVNDRHVIYFNYDSIVDFSIGVKNPEQDTLSSSDSSDSSSKKAETLNAYIEGKFF
jgi:2,3-bisphosphoglycerate-independent phosphoglycerate mutase